MGFFRDLNTLSGQGRALAGASPPAKYRMLETSARTAEANETMAAMAQGATQTTTTSGVAAIATITTARQTRMMVNSNPVVDLELLVMLPGGVPMPVKQRETVMQIHLGRCHPGMRVNVKIDPDASGGVWIDWVSPVQ